MNLVAFSTLITYYSFTSPDVFYPGHREARQSSMMSDSAGVPITTVLSILVVVNIIGNTLVCLIIKRNRDMRYTKSNNVVFLVTYYVSQYKFMYHKNV